MGKKSQIEILARVIALAISEGDTEKADEIMAWASAGQVDAPKKEPKDRTQAFIRKHLSPYAPYDKEKVERFINQNIVKPTKNVDFQVVKKKVGNMPYSEFLNTTYWRGVSLFIKRRDGWKCSKCGSTDKIEVHHKTYENHGDEIHNLGDLTTLCEKCHKEAHMQKCDEVAEVPPIPISPVPRRRRAPKTGSALSMRDILDGQLTDDLSKINW